ncbi:MULTISPECIES: ORF6N domain-containing protein [Bacillota]|uniref:ORF6N domain-containing protein n=1 Tax=Criibacterium bergeronii TaxID=1871336 RepID=A0A371IL61_9FIRM|nr:MULTISPECIES: ORF6N domain-containing protein [Bacillota]HEP7819663.1 ORF6N domain-containing protein [Streptococcus pyogenes]KAA9323183.1 ORF6N domain-containing protein [Streptococcus anginosus]RDY21228.1 ORF6N domain-containing protein [Criibacterium bergeronii]HES6293837.1 ORF6N domain-containing protein [Streptococcus pyogenes]HES6294353.1 ORF6N domain-containing protein [Streptococcus pyogenes]
MAEQNKEIVVIDETTIKSKIYYIRNQKVMLDFELAEIYGYETRAFNQQVKRNNEKFDDDFMFQLTDEEVYELSRSQNVTLKRGTGRGSNIKYNPYAFTEQGIYMLMTVLRGELAVKQSKALIRMFKQMKDFIIENQDFIGSKELVQIAIQTNQNTKDIAVIKSQMATKEDLKKVMDNFIDPETYKHFLLMNGDKIEADVAYTKIYKSAKKSIYVIDNYIGLKTLELLRAARDKTQIVVFSDNVKNKDMLTKNILDDFRKDYPNIDLKLKIAGKKYHDRYIAIDFGTENEAFYLCGASSKDAGNKISSITKIEESSKDMYHDMFSKMLNNKDLKI